MNESLDMYAYQGRVDIRAKVFLPYVTLLKETLPVPTFEKVNELA